jgi:hypothetical protein
MSQTTRVKRALIVTALAAAALAVPAPGTVSAAEFQAAPASAVRALSAPLPSARPGYWADTSCSEGSEAASTEGWLPVEGVYPLIFGMIDTCLSPGGVVAARDEGIHDSTPGSGPAWWYQEPGTSKIVSGVVKLSMISPGGLAYLLADNSKGEQELLTSCELCSTVHSATVPVANIGGWVSAGAQCKAPLGESKCSTSGVNAEISITSATFLLHDVTTPEATGLSGSLTESPVAGTAHLTLTAHDTGGPGVYRVAVLVDGQTVWSATPNLNENKCVTHSTYEEAVNFRAAQPCPQETPVHVEVPTTSYSDGQHLVEVEIEDAAGNKAVVFDKMLTIDNLGDSTPITPSSPSNTGSSVLNTPVDAAPAPSRGPANGTPASERATLSAEWLTSKSKPSHSAHLASNYGDVHTLNGRLTDPAGTPIAGAAIEVTEISTTVGATPTALTLAHTNSSGLFTAALPGTLTEGSITVAYRSHLGDPLPAATSALTVSIPAKVNIGVSPHHVRVGKTITFTGKLAGRIPPGGKRVVLEAREVGGSWVEFSYPKTNSAGKFTGHHRFRYPGPARYEFRALCPREADFPYAEGKSNIVHVKER